MGHIGLQNEFEAVYHVQKKCLKKTSNPHNVSNVLPLTSDAEIAHNAPGPHDTNANLVSAVTIPNQILQSRVPKSGQEAASKIADLGPSPDTEHVIKTYTVRVISKKKIEDEHYREEGERIAKDIKIHRALKLCPNVVKLLKVHESAQNVYLFLDYEGGGSIGDLID